MYPPRDAAKRARHDKDGGDTTDTDDGGGKKTADSVSRRVSQSRQTFNELIKPSLPILQRTPSTPFLLTEHASKQAKQGEISLIVFSSCIVQWRKEKCSGLGEKMDARGWFAALLLEGSSEGDAPEQIRQTMLQQIGLLAWKEGWRNGVGERGERRA